MGLCDWFAARLGPGADSISPDQLQKPDSKHVKATSFEVEAIMTEQQAVAEVPEPSIVIPWVLNEIVTSSNQSEYYIAEGHFELQAGRLLNCWREYGNQFPKELAAQVCLFMQKAEEGQQLTESIRWLAGFLLHIFTSKRAAIHIKINSQELWPFFMTCLGQHLQSVCKESPAEAIVVQAIEAYGRTSERHGSLRLVHRKKTEQGQHIIDRTRSVAAFLIPLFTSKRAAIHIKNGSQELWPSVLLCLGQHLQWACKESPAEAILMQARVRQLLNRVESLAFNRAYMKGLGHDNERSWTGHGKNVRNLLRGIEKLLRDSAGLEVEAKREAAKASAKRAPWEKGGGA
ncbi:hypothetical protein KFL_001090230 [Klebsormidium nitens]|uniref:Uncharacterized protein n=1 Tax=Klebsormidium nitens TaxID=105231 RepID=A0A1Y1HUR7_KLENI|nr:hypothetical protein KFL_001090230 [Klebsormidium nitens]|eukprot:GAQ82375.1 hypothetical protein KFL_001090230 [Klebsormidium nitens]